MKTITYLGYEYEVVDELVAGSATFEQGFITARRPGRYHLLQVSWVYHKDTGTLDMQYHSIFLTNREFQAIANNEKTDQMAV